MNTNNTNIFNNKTHGSTLDLFSSFRKQEPSSKPSLERTEIEKDYDRILFSAPTRRLADKTQVFPLEKNDSVRMRLTHSHEVSNLCRSIATNLVYTTDLFDKDFHRDIPPLLAAIGLAHDLGNPPFGHKGEDAIQSWFKKNERKFSGGGCFSSLYSDNGWLSDFLKFEGNAQTFRLLTKLQILTDDTGLNLTFGTLAAVIKYPVFSTNLHKYKKHGIFLSEKEIAEDVWKKTGLKEGQRHPLTYIMEACDDTAYLILDAEDAIKKGLVSYKDLEHFLLKDINPQNPSGQLIQEIVDGTKYLIKQKKVDELKLHPDEVNDISMQFFRAVAVKKFIDSTIGVFKKNIQLISSGSYDKKDLLLDSPIQSLREKLSDFDTTYAYKNRGVLELELTGYNTLHDLMDIFWIAITDRKKEKDDDKKNINSKRNSPFAAFAYDHISKNYKRVAQNALSKGQLPLKYIEAQLLTDMISGMTDTFAVDLHTKLIGAYREYVRQNKRN